jgi:hypothetical protein
VLSGIANVDCIYDSKQPFVAIGSTLRLVRENSVVWGSGIIRSNEDLPSRPRILAVRGPKTRERALASGAYCPAIYGDPGMLLPLIYRPSKEVVGSRVVIAPHFMHERIPIPQNVCTRVSLRAGSIGDIEQVIDTLVGAGIVLTSSLHVFIVCVAYGVPVTVFQIEGVTIGGDNVKFIDFCLGVGMDPVRIKYVEALTPHAIDELIQQAQIYVPRWSPLKLLKSLAAYLREATQGDMDLDLFIERIQDMKGPRIQPLKKPLSA